MTKQTYRHLPSFAPRPIILFVVAFLLLLAGCNSAAPEEADAATTEGEDLTAGYTFRPLDEIVDTDLEVTSFADDGSARLPLTTSVPVACSVIYGPTEAFGSLSVDQDMAGGAHSEHSPLLVGLQPETTYYYRVQGVDAEGTVYLSDLMTFTTPAFETGGDTDNLASPERGATITGASSSFGNAAADERWGVHGAVDGNPNTEWSSAGDGDEAWIEVQLAQPAQIDQIMFESRSMSDGTGITHAFTITTGGGETYGPYDVPDAQSEYTFDVDFTAQTLRFDLVDTSGGNAGIVDVAVFGAFVDE